MYLITQQDYLCGKSNKEIAEHIIKEELWFEKDEDGITVKENGEPVVGDTDNLMKNIRKWKKDFPPPI